MSPTVNTTSANINAVEPVASVIIASSESLPANKKRREPEGGNSDPPTVTNGKRRKISNGKSPAEEELIRMATDHLRMVQEELESEEEEDPLEELG